MLDCAIIYIYIYIYSIDYWTHLGYLTWKPWFMFERWLQDGYMTVVLAHMKCQGSVAGDWDKSFNPHSHWPVYPLAPDRPHLEYKSAWAILLSCLKVLHETEIFHFSLHQTLQSDTEETSSTCYPRRVVEIWLRIFKSQWKHAISYLWVSYFSSYVCMLRRYIIQNNFSFISCFLWLMKCCCYLRYQSLGWVSWLWQLQAHE